MQSLFPAHKLNWLMLLLICTALFFPKAHAQGNPLPVEQAFPLTVTFMGPTTILAEWHIAPGYFLYTKRIKFMFDQGVAPEIKLPQGDLHYDKINGRSEVYSGMIGIPLNLNQSPSNPITLSVQYQGCAEDGFCYPPESRRFQVDVAKAIVTPLGAEEAATPTLLETSNELLTSQTQIQDYLAKQSYAMVLLMFLGLGLLLAFTPCILPMVPILSGIIVGHHVKHPSLKRALGLSFAYVLGSAITYALAGVLAAYLGKTIQVWLQQPGVIYFTFAVFVLLAASLFGWYDLRMPAALVKRLQQMSHRRHGASLASVFMLGLLSSLIISPCVTAPLVGVLLYIAQTGNVWLGGAALFMLGLGMGLPLILLGASLGKWLPKSGQWMEAVKKIFALLMLGMGIWMLSRVLSPAIMLALWGAFALCIALVCWVSLAKLWNEKILTRSVGLMAGILGVMLIVGPAHLPHFIAEQLAAQSAAATAGRFITVNSLETLTAHLAAAKAAQKPVLVDFYADWCASCLIMERDVFANKKVLRRLQQYVLLRADLTANSASQFELMQHFNVIAPPTILFFNPAGIEMPAERIVGEVTAAEFLIRLASFEHKKPVFPASSISSFAGSLIKNER